jgi:hypothetical protein
VRDVELRETTTAITQSVEQFRNRLRFEKCCGYIVTGKTGFNWVRLNPGHGLSNGVNGIALSATVLADWKLGVGLLCHTCTLFTLS